MDQLLHWHPAVSLHNTETPSGEGLLTLLLAEGKGEARSPQEDNTAVKQKTAELPELLPGEQAPPDHSTLVLKALFSSATSPPPPSSQEASQSPPPEAPTLPAFCCFPECVYSLFLGTCRLHSAC